MTVEARVLDLRRDVTVPVQWLSRATAEGTIDGWLVESQRRMKDATHMLCVRITAPDGRRLDLAFTGDSSSTNARGPVSGRLSPAVGYVFRATRSARAESECLTALERVFAAGWEAAGRGWQGPGIRDQIQAAAFGVDPAEVTGWRSTLVAQGQQSENSRWGLSDIPVSAVAALIDSGMPITAVYDWFDYNDLRHLRPETLSQVLPFHRAGWTKEQVTVLRRALTPPDSLEFGGPLAMAAAGWARLTFEQALLAVRAGVPVDEARRMVRENRFDPRALEMLASLRGTPGSGLLGLLVA